MKSLSGIFLPRYSPGNLCRSCLITSLCHASFMEAKHLNRGNFSKGDRRTKFMCLPRLNRSTMVARRSEERLEVKGGHGGSHTLGALDQEGNKIGCKKFMNYSKNNGKVKSPWMMYEFTMKDHEEYGLCRVFRKNKKDDNASTSASSSKRPEETDDDLSYAANNKRSKTSNYSSTSTAPMTSQPVDGGPAEECRSRFGSSSQPDAFASTSYGVRRNKRMYMVMKSCHMGCKPKGTSFFESDQLHPDQYSEASCFSNYAYPDTPLPPMQGPADDIPQESGTGSTSYVLSSTLTDEVCNWESTSYLDYLDVPPEGSYYDYQAEDEPTLQQNWQAGLCQHPVGSLPYNQI
ncbi:hypothetical protein IFM89_014264 [Coptis chinensis]|uniref:NAC domain-containing protein n=1 Tax=Coptis chinensis TaxID=261450 RepID=A0A835H671_9MAGN|nr:hypothetical protein IFM89_014264 [Coptis chinensis]